MDRALNDRPGVNYDVAQRIKKIAEDMGYRPNVVAKALASHRRTTVIGVIINSEGNEFFNDVLAGIDAARQEYFDFGIKVEVIKMKGYNPKEQLEKIAILRNKGIDALAITPVSDPEVRDTLNEMIHSDIPVVCFNLDLAGVDYVAYVGCDYFKSGQTMGGMIGYVTGGQAQVGIITCLSVLEGAQKRVEGCRQVLKEAYPGCEIVQVLEAGDDEAVSYQMAMKMLSEHKEIDTLCFIAGGVIGGLQAVCELGLENSLRVFTFDLTPGAVEGLKKGIIRSTICQQPFEQGYQSIKTLFEVLLNDHYPETDHIYTELNVKIKYNI